MRGVRRPLRTASGLAGTAVVLALAGGPAQAYPAPVCPATVSAQHLVGGARLTVGATSAVPRTWSIAVSGQRVTGHGTSIVHTFGTPAVTHQTTLLVQVSCGQGGHQTIPVAVLPPGSGAPVVHHPARTTSMPNTGGPSRGLLYGGVGLVLAGLATLGLRRSGRHGVR